MKTETADLYFQLVDSHLSTLLESQTPPNQLMTTRYMAMLDFFTRDCPPARMVKPGALVTVLFEWASGSCLGVFIFPSLRLLAAALQPTSPPQIGQFPSVPNLPAILTPNYPFFETLARRQERERFKFPTNEGKLVKAEVQSVE